MKRALFGLLLPLALCAAGWVVGRRWLAVETALADPSPRGLERAATLDPRNPDFPFMLASAYRDVPQNRDLDKALAYAQRAAELAPYGWRAHWELAQLHELGGDRAAAEAALRRALELNPHDPTLHWRLANLHVRAGEIQKSLEPMARALAGDRSLLRPALSILTKAAVEPEALDSVWPRDPTARLFLLRELTRPSDSFAPPHGFLVAEWEKLLGSPEAPPIERAAFFLRYLVAVEPRRARDDWIRLAEANGLRDEEFRTGRNLVWNGRFELPLSDTPLGWRISRREGSSAAAAPGEGPYDSTALRVDFDGSTDIDFSDVRQTIVVEGLRFLEILYQTRSEGLTGERGVLLEVYDRNSRRMLLRTSPVTGTTPWRRQLEIFEVPAGSPTVELRVRRFPGRGIERPFAGSYWLDNVVLVPAEPAPARAP